MADMQKSQPAKGSAQTQGSSKVGVGGLASKRAANTQNSTSGGISSRLGGGDQKKNMGSDSKMTEASPAVNGGGRTGRGAAATSKIGGGASSGTGGLKRPTTGIQSTSKTGGSKIGAGGKTDSKASGETGRPSNLAGQKKPGVASAKGLTGIKKPADARDSKIGLKGPGSKAAADRSKLSASIISTEQKEEAKPEDDKVAD